MTERVDPARAGLDPVRVARVIEKFRKQQARGVFPGGQLAVCRRGHLVVDEAVGIARGFRKEEREPPLDFTPELRSCVFSAGKPLVGVAVAVLEERGIVDVERTVASYWPEFAGAGKGEIALLDVLLHRSGLYLREIERDWPRFGDWDFVMARIIKAEPAFPRGTLAYQPMGFGWILGEIVQRVTGKGIERFLDKRKTPAKCGRRSSPGGSQLRTIARPGWSCSRCPPPPENRSPSPKSCTRRSQR